MESVDGFVGSCCSIPRDFLQVPIVELGDSVDLEKSFLNLLLDTSDIRILLRALKISSIVANNHCDPAFGWQLLVILLIIRLNLR